MADLMTKEMAEKASTEQIPENESATGENGGPPKKKRGRPKKQSEPEPVKRGRGRPPKPKKPVGYVPYGQVAVGKKAAKAVTTPEVEKKEVQDKPLITPKKRRVGRPTKLEIAARNRAAIKEERLAAEAKLELVQRVFKCTMCGLTTIAPERVFYSVYNNDTLAGNENRSPICISCANKLLTEYTERWHNQKLALILVCMHMGMYYSDTLYNFLHEREMNEPEKYAFSLGVYVRSLNGQQYKANSYLSFVLDLLGAGSEEKPFKNTAEVRDEIEAKWSAKDKRNKAMCIKEVGYDCFDDPIYSSADRMMMYNSLAQYLAMGDVVEDKHKRDAAINIVKTAMQIEFLDREMNRESRKPIPDFQMIEKLIQSKKSLNDMIVRVAKENAISAGSGFKHQKNTTAVTAIMKEMLDNGVLEVKTNLTDVKMTETFQNIAEISMGALVNAMNITGDEYAVMVGKQAETIQKLEKQVAKLEEDKRILTFHNHNLKATKPRYAKAIINIGSDYDDDTEDSPNE